MSGKAGREVRFIGWNANWIVVSERVPRNDASKLCHLPAPLSILFFSRFLSSSLFLRVTTSLRFDSTMFSDNSYINSRQIEIKTRSIEMQFTWMRNARAARRTEAEIVYRSRVNHAWTQFSPCDLLAVNWLLCICFWFPHTAIHDNYRIRRLLSKLRSCFGKTIRARFALPSVSSLALCYYFREFLCGEIYITRDTTF